jgi:hypothetical protein
MSGQLSWIQQFATYVSNEFFFCSVSKNRRKKWKCMIRLIASLMIQYTKIKL